MRRNFPPPSFSTTTTTNTTTSPNTDRSSSSTSSSPSSSWYEGYVNLTVDLLWRGSLLVSQFLITSFLILTFSLLIYSYLYRSYLPKPLHQERLYFNLAESQPSAYLTLLHPEKQWHRVPSHSLSTTTTTTSSSSSSSSSRRVKDHHSVQPWLEDRLLHSGMKYNIIVYAELAKSIRNYDLGNVVLHLEVIDSSNTIIAQSYRPLIMPFQSLPSLYLESIFYYIPFRFLLFFSPLTWLMRGEKKNSHSNEVVIESTRVILPMINHFEEPPTSYPPTTALRFYLSHNKMDLVDMTVEVLPQVRGLSYFLYYYPCLSAIVIISILVGVQYVALVGIIATYLLTQWVIKLLQDDRVNDDDSDMTRIGMVGEIDDSSKSMRDRSRSKSTEDVTAAREVTIPSRNGSVYTSAVEGKSRGQAARALLRNRRSANVQSRIDAISLSSLAPSEEVVDDDILESKVD